MDTCPAGASEECALVVETPGGSFVPAKGKQCPPRSGEESWLRPGLSALRGPGQLPGRPCSVCCPRLPSGTGWHGLGWRPERSRWAGAQRREGRWARGRPVGSGKRVWPRFESAGVCLHGEKGLHTAVPQGGPRACPHPAPGPRHLLPLCSKVRGLRTLRTLHCPSGGRVTAQPPPTVGPGRCCARLRAGGRGPGEEQKWLLPVPPWSGHLCSSLQTWAPRGEDPGAQGSPVSPGHTRRTTAELLRAGG